jgi:hypothetical protein
MRHTPSYFKKVLYASILFWLANTSVYGQHWTELTIPDYSVLFGPVVNRYLTPYFLNSTTGFIYCNARTYGAPTGQYPHLSRTTDGGLSWTYIPYFDTIIFRNPNGSGGFWIFVKIE